MQRVANVLAVFDDIDQLQGEILGMRGHKADALDAGNGVDLSQQAGEADGSLKVVAVAVNILTKEHDLTHAVGGKGPHLFNDVLSATAALASAHIRHDAVGTEVVAAIHDVDKGLEWIGAVRWQFEIGAGILLDDLVNRLAALGDLRKIVRQLVHVVGAEHEVHKRRSVQDLWHDVLLLDHATTNADDEIGLGGFEPLEAAEHGEHLALSFFADAAGVQQDEIRFLDVLGRHIKLLVQKPCHDLAVVLVHLTAEGLDIIFSVHQSLLTSANARSAAASTLSRSSWLCAVDRNQHSNWDGGKCTPFASIVLKKVANFTVSDVVASA